MDVYYFTECPYPDAWSYIGGPIRVSTPNCLFGPVKGADLLNQRLDEYVLADELGMNIMLNEHRSATTCLTASIIPPLAMRVELRPRSIALVLDRDHRLPDTYSWPLQLDGGASFGAILTQAKDLKPKP